MAKLSSDAIKEILEKNGINVKDNSVSKRDHAKAVELLKAKAKVEEDAQKLQDEIVCYVKDLADYVGVELELENVNYDGEEMHIKFSPDDLISISSDYDGDMLVEDIKKHVIKNKKFHVVYDQENDTFEIQISGLKGTL